MRHYGGIVFPKLLIRTGYINGALIRLEMVSIDRIELNENLPPDTFRLVAPKGIRVFLHSADSVARPEFVQLGKDMTDVAALIRDRAEQKAEAGRK